MFRAFLAVGIATSFAALSHAEQTTEQSPAINFTDHVLPIFRQHCLACHNANDAEAGLAIDSYGGLMEGGGSGDAVSDGDSSGSRLYQVMTHAEEPVMPPDQDPLPKEKLEIIRQWIEGGLLENSGSKAKKKKGPSLSFTALDASGKPSVIVMPKSIWRVPVVASPRAAAASAIAASPWAPLVAIAGQKQVTLYDTSSSDLVGIIPFPEGIPQALQFSLDGAYLLVAGGTHASQGVAALYDVKTGDRLLSVGDELDTVFGADINQDLSNIALGGPQKIVRIFEAGTGESIFELKKHTDWVYCVDYSPDGVLVASGDRSGGLHIWEASTGRLYLDLIGHKAAIRGLAWRADSNVLVSASEDGTVKMWEMNDGKQLKSFNAHGGGVTGVMMAKDGRIVTCGKDKTVKLWKADGSAIATMPALAEPALEAVITHDGSKVVGGDWSGRIVMWTVADPKQATELAANPPRLEDRQAELVARMAELDKAFNAATEHHTNQQKAFESAKKTHGDFVAKLATAKSMLTQANTAKTGAEKLLVELQRQRAEEDSKRKAVDAKVAALSKQIAESTAQLQDQQRQLVAAVARRDAASKEKDVVVATLARAQSEHEKQKADAVASLSAIAERELDVAAQEQVAAVTEAEAESELSIASTKVSELKRKLAVASDTIKQASEQLDAAKAESKKTAELIAALPAQINAAKTSVDAKNAEVSKIQQQLADASDENQKKTLREKLARSQGELDSARSQQAAVEKRLADANANEPVQDKLMQELAGKIAATNRDQVNFTKERDTNQKQVDGWTATRDTAAKQKMVFVAQLAQIRSQVVATEKMKNDAVMRIAELVRQESVLKAREQELSALTKREANACTAIEGKVGELMKSIESAKQTLTATKTQRQTVSAKVAELANALKAQPAAIAKIGQQLKQHTAAVPNLEKQIAETKKKVGASTVALASAKSAVDTARANIDATKTQLEGVRSELVAFNSQAEKLAAELTLAEAAATEKRRAVEPEAAKATKVAAALAARGQQLSQLTASLAKLQAQLAALQKAQAAEQKTLEATQAKLQQLEAEAEAVEDDAEAKRQKTEFFKSVYGS